MRGGGPELLGKRPGWGRSLLLFGGMLLFGILSFLYIDRFLEIRRLHAEIARISEEERTALSVQNELRDRLAHRDDPATIEYLARKELGLVKPGEEKVIFVKKER